jgi:transposase
MAPYSMDLRRRVAAAWDAREDAETVAERFQVSRAWVHWLLQRRRETGHLAPRRQTRWRRPVLADDTARLQALVAEQPDRTLAEIKTALGTDGEPEHDLAHLGSPPAHRQKKLSTPPSRIGLMSARRGARGSAPRRRSTRRV